jgi:SNARE protein 1
LNEAKIQLDRIDAFLNDVQKQRRESVERVSLLASLPTPALSIVPPDPDSVPPSVISTALLPMPAAESALFHRKQPGTTALHEELSLQLEQMAQQLKRNALHFSASLERDKGVVEGAGEKLEQNFGVMERQRVRLRKRGRGWYVCLVVLLVVVVFVLMAVVIRVW